MHHIAAHWRANIRIQVAQWEVGDEDQKGKSPLIEPPWFQERAKKNICKVRKRSQNHHTGTKAKELEAAGLEPEVCMFTELDVVRSPV